jgi:ABC-type cobalamin/Fe3+-siderophores transport system ATPase subunit
MTPTLVLLAGPNGAGKTTFLNQFLRERAATFPFVNPDEVARSLTGSGPARDLAACPPVKPEGDEAGAGDDARHPVDGIEDHSFAAPLAAMPQGLEKLTVFKVLPSPCPRHRSSTPGKSGSI